MSNITITKDEWHRLYIEYNVAYNNAEVVKDYYEDNLHNGKWKIIPISFCGVATNIAEKYLPNFLGFCDNYNTLTASIHILEPGCAVEEHVDDDFEVEIKRIHIPIFGFSINDINGRYKSHTVSDGIDIFEFDTTVPHSVKNLHKYNIVFLILDFAIQEQPIDVKVIDELFATFKRVGYFS